MSFPPDSRRYAEIRDTNARVREPFLFQQPRALNELELQARWFAGDFGRKFISSAGDKVEIIQFGTWNREAGPDFRDAAVCINGAEPVRGCIEIDLMDRNWETHGHAVNPAFESTALHIFVIKSVTEFFTRTISNRNVPQVQIDPAVLPDAFRAETALARPGRCQAPLKNLPEGRVRAVLDAAAQFRLQRKASAIRTKIDQHGRDEALFQEVAVAFGYKENKLPFTLISQRLTLKYLRRRVDDGEAILFGVAGFLRTADLGKFRFTTKDYLRVLWDNWWPHRDEFERLILRAGLWKTSSTRPSNRPERRLAALSILVRQWPRFQRSLGEASLKPVIEFFNSLDHPFWRNHFTFLARASPEPLALIGKSRITEILANVIFPLWQSEDIPVWEEYSKLPARLTNRRLITGTVRLFGDDPRQKDFLKTVAHQQGLLQIFEDFCLQDDSDCARCPFPEQMQKWE